MRNRIRILVAIVATLVLGLANPAFAETKPQLIDGSTHGAEAFIAMAVMIFLFVGLLFLIDRVRQKAEDEQDRRESGGH